MLINGSELTLNWHFLVWFLNPILDGCYIAVSTWPTYENTELRAVLEADIWLQACYTTLADEELAWNCIWSPGGTSTAQPIVRYGEGLKRMKKKKKITVDVITTWVCLCNVGGWIISQPFITQPWNSSTLITFNDKNMEKIRSQSRRGVFFWCRLSSLNASHCLFLSKAPLSYWFNNSDSYFSLWLAVWEADFF